MFESLSTGFRSRNRALFLVMIASLGAGLVGCQSLWDRHRENERMFALESARTHSGRGQCAQALPEFDRAQARIDLGAFAKESTQTRVRCYEKLGLSVVAAAHRRLIDDFYTEEPMAYPEKDGQSIFRVRRIADGGYNKPPAWLKIAAPRYTEYARRSKIIGRVVVSFEIAGNNRPKKIRVLEMPHPLLATWAIEAISQAKPLAKRKNFPALAPGTRFVTTFSFEYRFAGETETNPLDS